MTTTNLSFRVAIVDRNGIEHRLCLASLHVERRFSIVVDGGIVADYNGAALDNAKKLMGIEP